MMTTLPEGVSHATDIIGGDTFEDPSKVKFIDELDETDNVNVRLEEKKLYYDNTDIVRPEVEFMADGFIVVTLQLPCEKRYAEVAALEIGNKLNLSECEVIHSQVMHPSEGTYIEMKGKIDFDINLNELEMPEVQENLSEKEIRDAIHAEPMTIVAGTVGEDEHSVGLKETLDIKHGGIEGFGIKYHYLGTSVPVEKLVDAAIETNADAILASTIISHNNIHYDNMRKLADVCIEKGVRDKLILVAGGTQVNCELAVEAGMDVGFGRGSKGIDVASFLVERRREMQEEGILD